MNIVLISLVILVCGGTIFIRPTEAPAALAMCALASMPTIIILARTPEQRSFLMRLFILALVLRIVLATVIYVGHMEEFFGGDATTYDIFGQSLVEAWQRISPGKVRGLRRIGRERVGHDLSGGGGLRSYRRKHAGHSVDQRRNRGRDRHRRLPRCANALRQQTRFSGRGRAGRIFPVARSLVIAGTQRRFDHHGARALDPRDVAVDGKDHGHVRRGVDWLFARAVQLALLHLLHDVCGSCRQFCSWYEDSECAGIFASLHRRWSDRARLYVVWCAAKCRNTTRTLREPEADSDQSRGPGGRGIGIHERR